MNNDKRLILQLMEGVNYSICTDSSSTTLDELNSSSSSSTDNIINSSSDDDDLLLFPLMKFLTSGKKRQRIENYLEIIDSLSDQEFKEHLRINRRTALTLIDELELSGYIPSHSFGIRPLSAKLSFILFLWYIANTEPLRTLSDRFDISISSVFRVLRRITKWFLSKLDTIIKWPQEQNVKIVCDKFFIKQGVPNVLGAIDGTHIRIEKPSINARDYINRKKYFSICLQAVVDSDMRITNIYCGEPGSLHDSRVLRRSPLYEAASVNQAMLFPNQTFILGDSAYPSLPWLVSPYKDNGHLSPQQVEFNYMISSTRISVERAFGQLKGRFRRIKFFNEYRTLPFIINTVVAACILHNYCINENDTYDFPEYYDENINNILNNNGIIEENIPGDRRTQLFNEIFPC
ncbi:protein ANTAGONIST OF LIKE HETEROCHROMATIN PROTEIN 1-like [Monomorium pharaonis]|uniref:protein ANTAGONIST OF LIKE HETEROCHROMATIN PROTEIN 1-like n=1 Tax=Monomorium pharaonis TaxID=307658 RepID=UPI00174704B0|nr:protein ANTAGONIST OF LIKE HETEROCHROMATIN PROTEIN 1-like [Monomorium pharaonis]XP_036148644.1 protein ANTAGONIST OF LIKE HETEROCHROMATIN PROTEIN 1-like [Monomorium pharaonis]